MPFPFLQSLMPGETAGVPNQLWPELWRRLIGAQMQPQSSPLPVAPQATADTGEPLFSAEAATTAPTEQTTYPAIAQMLGRAQPTRSTITGQPDYPQPQSAISLANQIGTATVPETPSLRELLFGQQYVGQHPRLSRALEGAAYWQMNPEAPLAALVQGRAAEEMAARALPGQRLKSGLETVGTLDKMRREQMEEDQKAQQFPVDIDLKRAQTLHQQALAQQALQDQVPEPKVVGGALAIPDPTAEGGYRFLTPPLGATEAAAKTEFERAFFTTNGRMPTLDEWEKYRQSQAAKGEISPTAESNLMMRLSSQWSALTKEVREMQRQSAIMDAGIEAARRGDMAAGSQGVLVTFQKILDPTSVVRESEYARSASGQSLLNQIEGGYDRLARGGAGVPLDELEKFARLAKEFVQKAASSSNLANEQKRLGMIGNKYGIPPEFIFGPVPITEQGATTTTPTSTPQQLPSPAPTPSPANTPQDLSTLSTDELFKMLQGTP